MKKLSIFVVLLFLASMFNSCEDDEVASLIGKWLFETAGYEYYEDDVLIESGTSTDFDVMYLEFFKGGNGNVWFDAIEYETFTWTKDGKTVNIDDGGEQITVKILKLTSSTLKFSQEEEEEDGGVVYKYVMIMNMTRVED